MKNDTIFVSMRCSDHLGDAKSSKTGTSLRRIYLLTNRNRQKRFFLEEWKKKGRSTKRCLRFFNFLSQDLVKAFQSLMMILPPIFRLCNTITKSLGTN